MALLDRMKNLKMILFLGILGQCVVCTICAVQLCRDRVQHFPKVSFALSVEYAERKSRLSASATLFLGLGSRHFYERENAEKLKKKQQKYVAIFFLYSGMFVAKTFFFSSQNNF